MQLKEGLSKVKFGARSDIFYRALSAREKYAIDLISFLGKIEPKGFTPKSFHDVFDANAAKFREIGGVMEAAIVIFKSLLETTSTEGEADESNMLHRYYAQLAYAMKDLLYCNAEQFDNPSKWSEIIKLLDKAIELRPADARSADTRDLFSFYELNKAIALIEKEGNYARQAPTSDSNCEMIISLLRKAEREAKRRNVELERIFPIEAWLQANQNVNFTFEIADSPTRVSQHLR
jgi:hypothetical protein